MRGQWTLATRESFAMALCKGALDQGLLRVVRRVRCRGIRPGEETGYNIRDLWGNRGH